MGELYSSHLFVTREDYTAEELANREGHHPILDGGLSLCKVCGQAEGELEAFCPGPLAPGVLYWDVRNQPNLGGYTRRVKEDTVNETPPWEDLPTVQDDPTVVAGEDEWARLEKELEDEAWKTTPRWWRHPESESYLFCSPQELGDSIDAQLCVPVEPEDVPDDVKLEACFGEHHSLPQGVDKDKLADDYRPHSTHSASGSKMWMACPGSIRMQQGKGDGSSVFAREGTAAHAVLEHCLRAGMWSAELLDGGKVSSATGKVLEPGTHPDNPAEWEDDPEHQCVFPINPDMVSAVDECLAYVKMRLEELGPHAELRFETQVDLSWVRPGMFGTNDIAIVVPWHVLETIDYKHGRGVAVEVEENSQTMYYATGTAHAEGWIFDEYKSTIVQPRLEHEDGPVRSWSTDERRLKTFAIELADAYDRTQDPEAPLVAGEHCRFCRARAQCPTLAEAATAAAQLEFDEFLDSWEPTEMAVVPTEMSDEDLVRSVRALPLIDAFVRAVKGELNKRVMEGKDVGGYKVVRKKTNRTFGDEAMRDGETLADAFRNAALDLSLDDEKGEKFLELIDFDVTAFVDSITASMMVDKPKVLGPAKIEKLGKPFRAIVPMLAFKPEGGLTVAPPEDPRPAVNPAELAASDFDDVPDGELEE